MRSRFSLTIQIFLLALLLACGDRPSPFTEYSPDKQVVMVVDTGFDIHHPVFEGKVLATYTIVCGPSTGPRSESIAEHIIWYEECRLEEGIELEKSPGFTSIARHRIPWNSGVRAKDILRHFDPDDYAAIPQIDAVLSGLDRGLLYHGTGTAGLVAFDNDVQLVLVQLGLPSREQADQEFECFDPVAVAAQIARFNDPDQFRAFVEAPPSSLESDYLAIIREHHADLINESFGPLKRNDLEELSLANGCPPVDFGELFEASGRARAARADHLEALLGGSYPLTVRSAGNSGDWVNSLRDDVSCGRRDTELVVGSLDAAGQRSAFSVVGDCVDLYMLGEDVIVAAPDSFLYVQSGTSFSAPLAARYLTQRFGPGMTAQEIRAAVLGELDALQVLPGEPAPLELAFEIDTRPVQGRQYAMTREVTTAGTEKGPEAPFPAPVTPPELRYPIGSPVLH